MARADAQARRVVRSLPTHRDRRRMPAIDARLTAGRAWIAAAVPDFLHLYAGRIVDNWCHSTLDLPRPEGWASGHLGLPLCVSGNPGAWHRDLRLFKHEMFETPRLREAQRWHASRRSRQKPVPALFPVRGSRR
jgi:hypothetical protein